MIRNLILALTLCVTSLAVASPTTQALFTAYDIASGTFVYDSSAGATADAGWIEDITSEWDRQIVVDITTFNASSITVQIEGRVDLGGTFSGTTKQTFIVLTKVYTGTTTDGDSIMIVESLDDIRVGLKVAGDTGVQAVTVVYHSR